jgi:xanthine dehydrogenase iron-sulfur cluster and FAD-binding subunit A
MELINVLTKRETSSFRTDLRPARSVLPRLRRGRGGGRVKSGCRCGGCGSGGGGGEAVTN